MPLNTIMEAGTYPAAMNGVATREV
jgi:hypothetical protein